MQILEQAMGLRKTHMESTGLDSRTFAFNETAITLETEPSQFNANIEQRAAKGRWRRR